MGRGHSKRGPLGHWQCFISPSGWYSLCDNLSTYICNICAFTCIIIHNIKAIFFKIHNEQFQKSSMFPVKRSCLCLGFAGRGCRDKTLAQQSDPEMFPGSPAGRVGQWDGPVADTC